MYRKQAPKNIFNEIRKVKFHASRLTQNTNRHARTQIYGEISNQSFTNFFIFFHSKYFLPLAISNFSHVDLCVSAVGYSLKCILNHDMKNNIAQIHYEGILVYPL